MTPWSKQPASAQKHRVEQILAADLVRLNVGRSATHTFVERGPLALKGLPEPVTTVEVLWDPDETAIGVPLPGRLVGAAADALFGFFGREQRVGLVARGARKWRTSTKRAQLVLGDR